VLVTCVMAAHALNVERQQQQQIQQQMKRLR
jgi:hypothetical protein